MPWGCGQNLGLFFRDGRMSMYSREKRVKAVELYIKYDKSAADVIRELGYPDRHTLRSWYGMYLKEQETGVIHDRYMSRVERRRTSFRSSASYVSAFRLCGKERPDRATLAFSPSSNRTCGFPAYGCPTSFTEKRSRACLRTSFAIP